MPKFKLELKNVVNYELIIDADSEEHAYELSKEWGRDELESDETSNRWDIEITEVPNV